MIPVYLLKIVENGYTTIFQESEEMNYYIVFNTITSVRILC